jgi:hypothetical protein
MNRYSQIPITKTKENPSLRYANVKYPNIPLDPQDLYVYTTIGDRYDLIAQSYYSDSRLWWVINRANPNQPNDSLYPTSGTQIRIPASNRISSILAQYMALNQSI